MEYHNWRQRNLDLHCKWNDRHGPHSGHEPLWGD